MTKHDKELDAMIARDRAKLIAIAARIAKARAQLRIKG